MQISFSCTDSPSTGILSTLVRCNSMYLLHLLTDEGLLHYEPAPYFTFCSTQVSSLSYINLILYPYPNPSYLLLLSLFFPLHLPPSILFFSPIQSSRRLLISPPSPLLNLPLYPSGYHRRSVQRGSAVQAKEIFPRLLRQVIGSISSNDHPLLSSVNLSVPSCTLMLCNVMSCYVMSRPVMPSHVRLYPLMSCHVMSCYALSCHAPLCNVMSCPFMFCYVMLCRLMLCPVR